MHTFLRNDSRLYMTSINLLYSFVHEDNMLNHEYKKRLRISDSSTHYWVLGFTNSKRRKKCNSFLLGFYAA